MKTSRQKKRQRKTPCFDYGNLKFSKKRPNDMYGTR